MGFWGVSKSLFSNLAPAVVLIKTAYPAMYYFLMGKTCPLVHTFIVISSLTCRCFVLREVTWNFLLEMQFSIRPSFFQPIRHYPFLTAYSPQTNINLMYSTMMPNRMTARAKHSLVHGHRQLLTEKGLAQRRTWKRQECQNVLGGIVCSPSSSADKKSRDKLSLMEKLSQCYKIIHQPIDRFFTLPALGGHFSLELKL